MTRATVDLDAPPPTPPEDLEDLALRDDYALNPRYVGMVVEAADRGDAARLEELVGALHPADIADLMGFLSAEHRKALIPFLAAETLAEILPELDTNIREEILERVAPDILVKALGELESDDAAEVVDDLEDDKRDAVLAALSDSDRAAIETTLGYDEDSAGRLMQREVLRAPQFWTVGQAIAHIRDTADDLPELFFDVYVVDPAGRPIGAVAVSQFLKASPDASLASIMESVTEIPVDMDQEEVAYIFDKYHLVSAPVTDAGGRLVGQITVDDIVGVIRQESEEDILAMHGVSDAGRDASIMGITRSRFWWLLVNLGTAILASSVISLFEGSIAKLAVLAVLNPIVASMGGNAGTQTLAVAVRALATKELTAANAVRIIWREIAAGVLNGLAFALVMGVVTVLWFHTPMMAIIIGLAMVINLFAAAVAGILIPLLLDRLGYDPAHSAVVFLTTVTDCVGFFSFLGLATLILF